MVRHLLVAAAAALEPAEGQMGNVGMRQRKRRIDVSPRFDQRLTSRVWGVVGGTMMAMLIATPAFAQPTEVAKLTASDAAADDVFGNGFVSISGDTAVVGAYLNDDAGTDSGSAYVFVRNGTSWTQQAKLTASDAAAGDQFGFAVSISGDTAVVGAFGNDDAGSNSGSAYVFVRSGTSWTQQAKLTASDAAAGDGFGVPVSISGDTAVVGAAGTSRCLTNLLLLMVLR